MRLELLGNMEGMGILQLPTIPTTVPTAPKTTLLQSLTNTVTKVAATAATIKQGVDTVKQVFNPGGQTVQNPVPQVIAPTPEEKDNTMLYVGLGVGGALLLTGVALAVSKKKKARGMGRVKRGKAPKRKASNRKKRR